MYISVFVGLCGFFCICICIILILKHLGKFFGPTKRYSPFLSYYVFCLAFKYSIIGQLISAFALLNAIRSTWLYVELYIIVCVFSKINYGFTLDSFTWDYIPSCIRHEISPGGPLILFPFIEVS